MLAHMSRTRRGCCQRGGDLRQTGRCQAQIASILSVQGTKGRRDEFDREGRAVIYDGRQVVDALWIVDQHAHYVPLGL